MVSLPPRKHLLRLSLLLIGISCIVIGIGGVTDPQATDTYSLEKTDTATYNFTDLLADAQRVVEDGSDTTTPVAIEDVPDEFSQNRVTLVRYEGTLFCVQAEGDRESNQAPEGTPTADQTVSVEDCADVVFEFNSLSPQGKEIVSLALDSSNNQIRFSQDVPSEFYAEPGDGGVTHAEGQIPPGNGIYYIIKDGTVYQFHIRSGGFAIGDGVGGALVFVAGLALVMFGAFSYSYTRIRLSALIVAPVSVVIIPELFWVVGLRGWAVWLDQQPKHFIAIVLLLLAGWSVALYSKYQQNDEV